MLTEIISLITISFFVNGCGGGATMIQDVNKKKKIFGDWYSDDGIKWINPKSDSVWVNSKDNDLSVWKNEKSDSVWHDDGIRWIHHKNGDILAIWSNEGGDVFKWKNNNLPGGSMGK
jgi:hypothetical protein